MKEKKSNHFYQIIISSVQFHYSIVSDSLQPHELQHARPPCPSPTPEVYSNSYPSSRWCHPAISSSVIPFSSCPQSLPESGSFLINECQNVIWKKILIRKKERANWILVWSNCPEESQKLSEIQYYIVEHSINWIFWFLFMSNWKAQKVE